MEEDEASANVRDARAEIYTDHAMPCRAVGFIEFLPSSQHALESTNKSTNQWDL